MRVVLVLFAVVVATAVASPISSAALASLASNDALAETLKNDVENIGVDGYNYEYKTSNGISAEEKGQLINVGSENEAIAVRGQFQYTGVDGVVYSVNYVADENGFQPQGAHLPVAPQ